MFKDSCSITYSNTGEEVLLSVWEPKIFVQKENSSKNFVVEVAYYGAF